MSVDDLPRIDTPGPLSGSTYGSLPKGTVLVQDPKSKEWAWELVCYGQYNDPEEPKDLWPNPKEGEGFFKHDWEVGDQPY